MGALPIPIQEGRTLPDYLPARMVNEFAYCPRLFFYEWVEGVFEESTDTVEGAIQHRRVDAKATALPEAAAPGEEPPQSIHARSVTLTSERLRVIAKMDLVELEGGTATPVDYKHGHPREGENGLELWPSDRAQVAVQGMILRENGYGCEEGIVYYRKTGQRVRVALDAALVAETEGLIQRSWSAAEVGEIPPPLVDSPKCPGCSLVGICLPDETLASGAVGLESEPQQLGLFETPRRKPVKREVRALVTPRNERRPLYLNSQGVRVGKSGAVLQVKDSRAVLQEVRIGEICQVSLMGNVQISTQAVQALCEAEVPICYFSMGGWFYGITTGLNQKNVFLRRSQFRLSDQEYFTRAIARRLVEGKIRNQRTLLQRNHIEPRRETLAGLKEMGERAERAGSLGELLGIEGNAARMYFGDFAGMIKPDEDEAATEFRFDLEGRNRRPPRDPVNAMLSLGYSLLAKDLTVACFAVGFDPYVGFYHQPRFGRPALALDLMEPFRPLIVDSAVLTAINTGMVTARDFVRVGGSVALTAAGRKGFFRAYELRMDTLATHPLFDYRVTYRRMLEIQARLLARVIEGEIGEYPVFTTR
ncbi:CRISPR-associated protein Cas4/endonuclease Cas1 fusion [Candidatus Sulfopaludibacter sp. SbA6]|nr:CRISPR-associated protein Cas4/endonuclease Cas1 fusion [Candidatus Sulfopaludibacter sp. SbA6]